MPAFEDWVGRQERRTDVAVASSVARLAALLDYNSPPWADGELPPLGHWLCFLPDAVQSALDSDGHPQRGGFLPPIELPRRMWAGGRLEFHAPLMIGESIERVSTITGIRAKTGASGQLTFVTVRHEISGSHGVAVVEEQDLVYREATNAKALIASPPTPLPLAEPVDRTRRITPDLPLLFRFSALTFNAHRIHYDRDYARDVEHYGGLVVQGPLIAMLLMDLWMRDRGRCPVKFAFRAERPLLDTASFDLCLNRTDIGATLWSRDAEGRKTMAAEIVG